MENNNNNNKKLKYGFDRGRRRELVAAAEFRRLRFAKRRVQSIGGERSRRGGVES